MTTPADEEGVEKIDAVILSADEDGNIVDFVTIKNLADGGDPPSGFDEWLELGERLGYVTGRFCAMHDGPPLTNEESQEFEKGHDPCVPALRVNP